MEFKNIFRKREAGSSELKSLILVFLLNLSKPLWVPWQRIDGDWRVFLLPSCWRWEVSLHCCNWYWGFAPSNKKPSLEVLFFKIFPSTQFIQYAEQESHCTVTRIILPFFDRIESIKLKLVETQSKNAVKIVSPNHNLVESKEVIFKLLHLGLIFASPSFHPICSKFCF